MLRPVLIGVVAVLLMGALGTVPASAASGADTPATAPPQVTALVPAFVLPATNGYRAFVLAGAREGGPAEISLTLSGHMGDATYIAPARVTETTIEARFGALGEIDIHAVPSGHTVTQASNCDGSGKRQTIETGRWEGTIRFRGEGGFTTIDATGAPTSLRPLTQIVCGIPTGSEGTGGHSPGARLTVRRRSGKERLELTIRKNKRVGPTRLHAEVAERRGKLFIDRAIDAVAPSAAFDFEFPPGDASVAAPSPFSGNLDFSRHGGTPSLKGNLTVDFPGRATVPVLGPGKVSAGLVRAVLNPSHPF